MNLQQSQSYLDAFHASVLSTSVYGKIKSLAYADKAQDLIANMQTALEQDVSFWMPASLLGPGGVRSTYMIDVNQLYHNVNDGYASVPAWDVYRNVEVPFSIEEVTEALSSEIEVSKASSLVLALLSTAAPALNPAELVISIKSAIGEQVSSGGKALMAVLSSLSIAVSNTSDLITSLLSLFNRKDEQDIFKGTAIGEYTSTSGIGLWASALGENVISSIQILVTNAVPALTNIASIVAASMAYAGLKGMIWLNKIKYSIDDFFGADPWVRLSDQDSDDPSFLNGFVDLGEIDDVYFVPMVNAGYTFDKPLAIPTLGATWYLYENKDNHYCIGFIRHLYDFGSAQKLFKDFERENWDEIDINDFALKQVNEVGLTFSGDVEQSNEYLYKSLRNSSFLIRYGLELLTGFNPTFRMDEVEHPWMFVTPASDAPTRDIFLSEAVYDGTSWDKQQASRVLSYYVQQFYSTDDSIRSHCHVSSPLSGYSVLQDDESLVLNATNTSRDIFVGAIVIATVVAAAVGMTKLIGMRNETNILLTRAINDTSVSTEEIGKLRRRANFFNAITGASVGGSVLKMLPSSRENDQVNNDLLMDDFRNILDDTSIDQDGINDKLRLIVSLIAGDISQGQ